MLTYSTDEPKKLRNLLTWLNTVQRLLLIVAVGLAVYIGSHFLSGKGPEGSALIDNKTDDAPVQDARPIQTPLPEATDYSQYAQIFESRDVFLSPFTRNTKQPAQEQQTVSATPGVDLSRSYKVLGIMVDHNPQAVILDVQKQETVFLSLGDKMGEAQVKEIKDGRIILDYYGQKVELTP